MPQRTPCPDAPLLEQLLSGRVPPSHGDLLYDHLAECDRCAAFARTFRAEDALTAAVRGAAAGRDEDGPSVAALIASLQRQGPPPDGACDLKATALSDTLPPAGGTDEAEEERFDFLAPPRGPDELGRLGLYRILKVLGSGGMGVVFHAEDAALGRPVAVKAMRPGLAANAAARQRFLREGRAAAALHHDHIVPVYQVGEDRGVPFLVMPLLRGESLEDRLEREPTLPAGEVVRIGREIALGLAAAHEKGLIHRDVKPANVWLESDGECGTPSGGRVKILDFGLAQATAEARLTRAGAILGTPAFMAPEQAAGRPVDARTDLFSLGCVLYRMATGRLPFHGPDAVATLVAVAHEHPRPPADVQPDVPPALSALVMRLLAKDPADRPASARATAEGLVKILAAAPPRGSRQGLRAWAPGALVLLASAAVAAGLISACFRSDRATAPGATAPAVAAPKAESVPDAPAGVSAGERPRDKNKSDSGPAPATAVAPAPTPLDNWQVVAQLASSHLKEGPFGLDYRAVALRPPYVYAMTSKSFVSGDLVVFRLPAERPKPNASLLQIDDCQRVEDAGDGGDLCVVGDALLCTHLGGLKVFSLEDPARPRFLRRVGPAALPRLSNSLIRHGNLACLVGETGNIAPASHLSVFDLSNPVEPRHVSLSLLHPRVWCGCSSGAYLYLGALKMWEGERNGVAAFDLANPEAPREAGFVETETPYHVFPTASGKQLVAVTGGHLQALSLTDPAKPALLRPAALIEEGGSLGGRAAALVTSARDERLVSLQQVVAVEETGFRKVYRFNCWNVGSGFPHHGDARNGYVAVPTQRDVVVLWSANFEAP